MAAFNRAGRLVNRRLFCPQCFHFAYNFNHETDQCEKPGYPCPLQRRHDDPAWAAMRRTGELGYRLRDEQSIAESTSSAATGARNE